MSVHLPTDKKQLPKTQLPKTKFAQEKKYM